MQKVDRLDTHLEDEEPALPQQAMRRVQQRKAIEGVFDRVNHDHGVRGAKEILRDLSNMDDSASVRPRQRLDPRVGFWAMERAAGVGQIQHVAPPLRRWAAASRARVRAAPMRIA